MKFIGGIAFAKAGSDKKEAFQFFPIVSCLGQRAAEYDAAAKENI